MKVVLSIKTQIHAHTHKHTQHYNKHVRSTKYDRFIETFAGSQMRPYKRHVFLLSLSLFVCVDVCVFRMIYALMARTHPLCKRKIRIETLLENRLLVNNVKTTTKI